MRYAILLMVLLAAGCLYSPFGSGQNQTNQTGTQPSANNTSVTIPPANETISPPPVPPLPPLPPVDEPSVIPATQEACSTLTPVCGSCVAKSGCGWCKSSNSCFSGTASGPTVSSCPSSEWTVTSDNCAAPVGGSQCSEITNCASCLTGSACMWCIQGSVCTDASSQDSCLGGWLNKSYQCNYASR